VLAAMAATLRDVADLQGAQREQDEGPRASAARSASLNESIRTLDQ